MWKGDIDTFGPMDSNTTNDTNDYDNNVGVVSLLILAGIIICWFGISTRSNNNYEKI